MAVKSNHHAVDENTLNTLPVPLIIHDHQKIYFMNRSAMGLINIKETIYSKAGEVFKSVDFRKSIKEFLEGKSKQLDTDGVAITTLAGNEFSVKVSSVKITFSNKTLVQSVLIQKAESATQNAKDLLEKISANGQDVIFHFGFEPRMELKFISDSSRNMLGFSPKEIYQNPNLLKNHLHEKDRPLLVITRNEYLKQTKREKDQRIVVRFKHKNGKYRTLEIAVNPVFDKDGQLAGLLGNMRDITSRIETEAQLMETKHKFDLITNNANDIICFYSYYPEEKYLYISPNIKKILGYEAKELINDKQFFTKRLVGENESFFKAEELLRKYQKKNIVKNHHFSFKIRNKAGEEVWLENNLVPITNTKGKIDFFINILRDVTEQMESDLEIENQYLNYRNLLDNSPVAYVIHDHGVCLYVNNALMKMLNIKHKNQVLGKFGLDFFNEEDRKRAVERIKDIYEKGGNGKFYSYAIKDVHGNLIEIEIKSVLIKFNNKDCILSLVNNLSEQRQREKEKVKALITETANRQLQKEIKERQDAEKNLTEKTAHLSSIFESSTHLIWTVNDQLEVTSFNQNFYNTVKAQHGVSIIPGLKIDEHLSRNRREYVNFWYTKYAEAFKGKKLEFEKEDTHENRSIYRKIFINPIIDKTGKVTEISCIANDITDSKIYEQKLLNQTGKLSAIFDSSHHYIWTIDREGRLTSFNKNYYDLVTAIYNTKPFLGLVLNRGVLANDKDYNELLQFHYGKAFSGLATSFEIETKDKDHKNIYLEIFFNPIYENDKVVEVSGIAHNITEKKHVQQRMEVSLKEKEVLLREVHHRVKNNMQVISSILNLQSSYVSDEYALTLLKESQNRIKTMAYIHESLYQNKSFTSVNFSEYVYTLVNNIVQSYSYSSDKVKLEMNIDKIILSLDSSIPAGLIINELITNSIKHAFPGSRQGTIVFNLKCQNNSVFLEIKDNGAGFAEGIDFENSHSLGLQLVNTLIEQIEGKLKFKSEKEVGTEVLITFKM